MWCSKPSPVPGAPVPRGHDGSRQQATSRSSLGDRRDDRRVTRRMTAAPTIPGLDNPPLQRQEVLDWVAEVAELTTPDRVVWFDRIDGGVDAPHRPAGRGRHVHPSRPREEAELVLRRLRPQRRRARRGPHLHLLGDEKDAGPTNNWMDPAEMKAIMTELYRGLHARPHDVRHPVLHGPARGRAPDVRRRDHRLASTSSSSMRVMARMGTRRARAARGDDADVRARPALGRRAARAGPGRRAVALQRHQVHRPVPRGADDLVLRLRATAATRCSARSATRCASPR